MTHSDVPTPMKTITIPLPSRQPVTLDMLDFGEAGADPVIEPIIRMARLRWLNGPLTEQQTPAIGWHVEAGSNTLLDETLEGMGMARYVVEHRMPDKQGQTHKSYWHLAPCSLIVIAEGVLSPQQMRLTQERTGIAYAREIERDERGEPKRYRDGVRNVISHKVLKVRAFVQELVAHGYNDWLPLTLTGTIVDTFFEALYRQIEVLKAFSGYTGRKAPFYAFALPVGAGPRRMVGPRQGLQSPIYPIVAQVPATIDQAYLMRYAVSRALVDSIREEVLAETVQWSTQESRRIAEGSPLTGLPEGAGGDGERPASPQEETAVPLAATVSPTPSPASTTAPLAPSRVPDPLVQKPQIDWIVTQYCQQQADTLQALCAHFGVIGVEQLRMSHFQALIKARQHAARDSRSA